MDRLEISTLYACSLSRFCFTCHLYSHSGHKAQALVIYLCSMTSTRFAFVAVLIAAVLATIHFFSYPLLSEQETDVSHLMIYPILALVYWFTYRWVAGSFKGSPRQFVNTFMLATMVRMFLCLLVLIPLILFNKAEGKFLAIYFVLGYFVYLFVEISLLFQRSRSES